jgi:hypothetical protein
MSTDVNVQAIDSQGGSPENNARLLRELEENLPALVHMIGVPIFHAICRQICDVVSKAPGGAIMVEKNTAKDGAFLYIGSHSFDVVAAIRKENGVEGLADKELPAATARVHAKRNKENN